MLGVAISPAPKFFHRVTVNIIHFLCYLSSPENAVTEKSTCYTGRAKNNLLFR